MSELIDASNIGDEKKVKELLETDININIKDDDGYTALTHSVYGGYLKCVKLLIKKGANVNIKDNNGYTALMEATTHGYIEIVKFLLENGADPNIRDNKGYTSLMIAADTENPEIVKVLLENGADPNIINNQYNTTALKIVSDIIHVASSDPILKIIILLIENGADPYIEDIYGSTALEEDLVLQIYSEHNILVSEVKKLRAKQRLEIAKMMIDPKHIDKPNDVIIKILKVLKIPPSIMSKKSKINELLNRSLQQELESEIQKKLREKMSKKMYEQLKSQFPEEGVSDMIEFYRKQLRNPNLTPDQRKAYKRQKRTRKRKLGIRTGSSDQSSSRKSRSSPSEDLRDAIKMSIREARSDKTSSSRKSRSMHSSEVFREAIKMSIREAKSGSKKKEKAKSKRKSSKKSRKKSK